jgi:hypothetical protein
MDTIKTVLHTASLVAFLAILFYFMPRATDRLHAKYPRSSNFWTKFWWSSVGYVGEPETITALIWFAAGGAFLAIFVLTSN